MRPEKKIQFSCTVGYTILLVYAIFQACNILNFVVLYKVIGLTTAIAALATFDIHIFNHDEKKIG